MKKVKLALKMFKNYDENQMKAALKEYEELEKTHGDRAYYIFIKALLG